MGLSTREVLQLMTEFKNIKSIRVIPNKEMVLEVEQFPPQPSVQTAQLPFKDDMPPDDVMMFAATEDIEELMKQRKGE